LWKVVAHLIRENKYKNVFFISPHLQKMHSRAKMPKQLEKTKTKPYQTVWECKYETVSKKANTKTNTKLYLNAQSCKMPKIGENKYKTHSIKQYEKANTKPYQKV
jgi:hypothetical protein